MINKTIDNYFKLQGEIFKHFGYVEDWVVIPIDDRREFYWRINGTEKDGEVEFCTESTFKDEDHLYSDVIYTQRFLPKWVYRAEDLTMICVDTQTDGNKFLAIFDNKKEVKE